MRIKRKTLYIVGLCAMSLSCCLLGGKISTAANNTQGWQECDIADMYEYKSQLSIENRSYVAGNKNYEASTLLYYPDGSVSSEQKVILDQAGYYTLKYAAQGDGKVYADSKSFVVNYPKYDVSKNQSSVTYGTPDRAKTSGVIAKLAQNDSLTFTDYIDFTKVTSDDNLVKGFVVPNVAQSADFSELVLTFTDSLDPSVYLQIHHYGHSDVSNTSVAANGQNQVPVGYNQTQGLKTNDTYGTWSCVSLKSTEYVPQNGKNVEVLCAPDKNQFYVTMSYSEKKVYCHGYSGQKTLCADLDDFSYVSNLWEGFPSGKARLSVSANGYTGATATVCITEVYGIDDLSNNVFVDSSAPVITVNDEYESMPAGIKDYEYAIPSASAYDAYAGECEVIPAVWFNYGMESAAKVFVADGKFKPNKVGTYSIVYESFDRMRNRGVEIRRVSVYESIAKADFQFPADTIKEAKIGEWVPIPKIDESAITGGSGKKTIRTFIHTNDGRKEIFGGFRAEFIGTVTVEYEIIDYVGKVEIKPYEVEISENDTPVLEKDFNVYPCYISGESYELPLSYAYVYKNGSLEKSICDIIVKDANGATTYKAGDRAIITVNNNNDKVRFEVVCDGVTLASSEATGILAWMNDNGRRFHLENYLVGDGFSVEKTEEGLLLSAVDEQAFSFMFANAISPRYVYLKVNKFSGAKENSKLTISLIDALNHNKGVLVTIGKTDGEIYVEANGIKKNIAGAKLDASGVFEITYQNGTFNVNGVEVAASAEGIFESGKAFLQICYEGYSQNAGFNFAELGNCRFNTAKTDRVSPIIFAQNEIGGVANIGSIYKIVAPVAYDVYSPNTVYTLTVTDPSGNVMRAVDGTVLDKANPDKDYEIILNQVGDYVIYYEIEESKTFVSKSNPVFLRYSVSVTDKDAPVITWSSGFTTELNVGDIFIVPQYTVSDNHSAEDKIIVRIFVETPESQLIMLPGNSIRMTHKGTYQVRVMVVDESGNIYSETHYVTVK